MMGTGARLLIAIAAALLSRLAVAGILCGDTGTYTANSTYQANLQQLADTLPQKTANSPTLFATTRVGSLADSVYAVALCRGDVEATACGPCVATAFQGALELCAGDRDATVYSDACYLHFSDTNFFTGTVDEKPIFFTTTNDTQKGRVDLQNFEVFDAVVGTLLNATADHAAADTLKWFATGEMVAGAIVPAIYALAQCMPVMAPESCRLCLESIIKSVPSSSSGTTGGGIIALRCHCRYELYHFFLGNPQLQLSAPENKFPGTGKKKHKSAKISAGVASVFMLLIVSFFSFIGFKRRKDQKSQAPVIPRSTPPAMKAEGGKCAIFDLQTLQEATNSFHADNKLGEGGFGTVYRVRTKYDGVLSDGQQIAVKLSRGVNKEGLSQLHNEMQLLSVLQHKNLVRLLGFCSHQDEMMLVYEHVMNGSLEKYLFDNSRGTTLNWGQRYNIILGIAKGIMYLHEDSSIKMIHRDLKANNILLDENMNPKVADFGLARLFRGDHTQTKTAQVVGTYGYMAPEYVMFGNVSPKTDVFSFGVLLLEIVTGRRNGSSDGRNSQVCLLITDVWNHWTQGKALQLVQKSQHDNSDNNALRCIHIGLLCVQQDPNDRPEISSIILMLTRSRIELQPPGRPAFFFENDEFNGMVEDNFSLNNITNTDPYPR